MAASNTVPAPITNSSEVNCSLRAFITSVAPGTVYVTSIAGIPPSTHALEILIPSSIVSLLTTATIPISVIFLKFYFFQHDFPPKIFYFDLY